MPGRPPIELCYAAVVDLALVDLDLAAHVAGWMVRSWTFGLAGVA